MGIHRQSITIKKNDSTLLNQQDKNHLFLLQFMKKMIFVNVDYVLECEWKNRREEIVFFNYLS